MEGPEPPGETGSRAAYRADQLHRAQQQQDSAGDEMEADRDDRRGQGRIMEALERVVPPRGQTPERGSAEEEEDIGAKQDAARPDGRSEEHTSELQSLMRNSYADFCLKKKNT